MDDPFAALPGLLERTILVRIWPGSVYPGPPPRKRRHGVALAKVDDSGALRRLQRSLSVLVGYLAPDWLRLEASGDRRLVDPGAVTGWIQTWAPSIASEL